MNPIDVTMLPTQTATLQEKRSATMLATGPATNTNLRLMSSQAAHLFLPHYLSSCLIFREGLSKQCQSINQSNFYCANIPGEARLSGATAELVFNSKMEETVFLHQQATGNAGIYGGEAKSKRCVFRCFLKVATELAEWTDSSWLF